MIIESIICALSYRIRGGLIDQIIGKEISNGWLRGQWALLITTLVFLKTSAWMLSPVIFITAFLGVVPGYFGGKFDLSLASNRNIKNYAWLTARGMFILFPCALVLFTVPFMEFLWYGVLAGALFVPCYVAGNVIYKYCKWQGWTQWGEILLGAAIGAALSL